MKFLLFLFLLIPSISFGATERRVLLASDDWCKFCPQAIAILQQPDMTAWIKTYHDNAIIDFDDNKDLCKALKITSIPTVLIVELDVQPDIEVDYAKSKILYRWQLDRSKDQGKSKLKWQLYKLSPKTKQTTIQNLPLLKRLLK